MTGTTVEKPTIAQGVKVPMDFDYRRMLDALGGPDEVVRLFKTHGAAVHISVKAVRAWYYRDRVPGSGLAKLAHILEVEGKGPMTNYLRTPRHE